MTEFPQIHERHQAKDSRNTPNTKWKNTKKITPKCTIVKPPKTNRTIKARIGTKTHCL